MYCTSSNIKNNRGKVVLKHIFYSLCHDQLWWQITAEKMKDFLHLGKIHLKFTHEPVMTPQECSAVGQYFRASVKIT